MDLYFVDEGCVCVIFLGKSKQMDAEEKEKFAAKVTERDESVLHEHVESRGKKRLFNKYQKEIEYLETLLQ